MARKNYYISSGNRRFHYQDGDPLEWPVWKPRTPAVRRIDARFYRGAARVDISTASFRAADELRRHGAANMRLTYDRADDPGAAAWFELGGQGYCIAGDKYTRRPDNVAAIAATVEAIRQQMRHGCSSAAEAFGGFRKELPPIGHRKPWWEILGVKADASAAEIKGQFHKLAHLHHPDKGGGQHGANLMAEITAAYAAAEREGRV